MKLQMPDMAVAATQLGVAAAGAVLFLIMGMIVVAGVQRASRWPLATLSLGFRTFDSILALHLAGLLGLDETQGLRRWGRLVAWFLGLAIAGAFLPAVVATPLLLFGLALVLAVVRRWTWDEEDRALGLAAHHKRAPGGEDFNNELVAALSCVFLFGALLVWRLAELGFFDLDPSAAQGGNILYVASEALEALPIIGNIEVFGYDNPSGVEVVQPTGGGAAFVFRLVLDVLVIGGLLKAAEIAGRIARKEDIRREEQALAVAGTEAEVNAALDAIVDLARRGNSRAARTLETLALPPLDGETPRVGLRRAAADHLLALGEEGALLGPGALNTAMLAYDVLLTPQLLEQDPLEYHLCLAARSQALYTLSLRTGGADAAERLKTAADGLEKAARGLHALGHVRKADKAELLYWAAVTERAGMMRDTPDVDPRDLVHDVQAFIDRMTARTVSDPEIVAEARRLLSGIKVSLSAHGDGAVDVADLAAEPDRARSPMELLDHAAAVILAVGQSGSAQGFALLDTVAAQLKSILDSPAEAFPVAIRGTAAYRMAQVWRLRVHLIHDQTRPQAIQQALHWVAETKRIAGRDVPRVGSAVQEIEAQVLSIQAALTPAGPDQDRLIARSLETYRRVIHDPQLAGDALLEQARANMVIALIGAAAGGEPALAVSRLREAESLSGEMLNSSTTARDRAMEASILLNRSVARCSLAPLDSTEHRRSLLRSAADDAEAAADLFAATGNLHGEALALKSFGSAHASLAEIEGRGPDAEFHARAALTALDRALTLLDPQRQQGLWFEAAFAAVAMMEHLGRVDQDRPMLERTVTRFDALIAASRDGPMAFHMPFLEQRRSKILAALKDWKT